MSSCGLVGFQRRKPGHAPPPPPPPPRRRSSASPASSTPSSPSTRAVQVDERRTRARPAPDLAEAAAKLRLPVQDAALREDAEQEARELAWQEAGLFNVDEEEHASRLQAAVASSNILRNLSFVPSNHASLIAESKFLECLLEILEAHQTEDDELVTNAIEIIANIAYLVNLRPQLSEDAHSSSSLNDRLLECLKMMLEAEPRVWHVAAAEALSLLASNGNNEPVLPSLVSLFSGRLVELLAAQAPESSAAAAVTLCTFSGVNADCRILLAQEPWLLQRLLGIIRAPHPFIDVCRKAALTLENIASEPRNRDIMLMHEQTLLDLALSNARVAESAARTLWKLSSDANARGGLVRNLWTTS
eukprot:SM000209S06393  [mRNA]  locus=s209:169036:171609:- [translate_table: standard]